MHLAQGLRRSHRTYISIHLSLVEKSSSIFGGGAIKLTLSALQFVQVFELAAALIVGTLFFGIYLHCRKVGKGGGGTRVVK